MTFYYDRDGRVDVLVLEGSWNVKHPARDGYFRLFRNVRDLFSTSGAHYLQVRVGSSASLRDSWQQAVVLLKLDGWLETLCWRVGGSGMAVSMSYDDTLHFDLCNVNSVPAVVIRWMDGSEERRRSGGVDPLIRNGRFSPH